MKFEKGKWYYYYFNNNQIYYLRCSNSTEGNTIYWDGYILEDTNKKDIGLSPHSYENDYVSDKEVPMELVRQYLPENHPDLLTKEINIVLW